MKENELQVLSQVQIGDRAIPVYGTPSTPLFKAADIAAVLEHTNPSKMVASLDEEERPKQLLGRQGETIFITEAGLYELLFLSRKPIAKRFKGVVKNILKELRTKGEVSIKKTPTMSKNRIEAEFEFVRLASEMLNLSDESKASMMNKISAKYDMGASVEYLPLSSNGVAKSATELLKQFGIPMSAQAFNKALVAAGYYNVHTRHGKHGDKQFYSLNDKGLAFGKNDVNPDHPERVQANFYENTFTTLVNSINLN